MVRLLTKCALLLLLLLLLLACGNGTVSDLDERAVPAPDAAVFDSGIPTATAMDAGLADAGASVDAGGPATEKGATARLVIADGGRLVDVRTPTEYAAGHVDGARNIPVGDLPGRLGELEPKSQWVVVYCRSGGRSAQAATVLRAAGFLQVFDLGPMSNW